MAVEYCHKHFYATSPFQVPGDRICYSAMNWLSGNPLSQSRKFSWGYEVGRNLMTFSVTSGITYWNIADSQLWQFDKIMIRWRVIDCLRLSTVLNEKYSKCLTCRVISSFDAWCRVDVDQTPSYGPSGATCKPTAGCPRRFARWRVTVIAPKWDNGIPCLVLLYISVILLSLKYLGGPCRLTLIQNNTFGVYMPSPYLAHSWLEVHWTNEIFSSMTFAEPWTNTSCTSIIRTLQRSTTAMVLEVANTFQTIFYLRGVRLFSSVGLPRSFSESSSRTLRMRWTRSDISPWRTKWSWMPNRTWRFALFLIRWETLKVKCVKWTLVMEDFRIAQYSSTMRWTLENFHVRFMPRLDIPSTIGTWLHSN